VIAADEILAQFARAFDDFIRTGTVAYDVAQIDDYIVRWSRRQASLKSFEIAVNVA
jgi:hypothetical protein